MFSQRWMCNGLILGWDCLLSGGYLLRFRNSGSHCCPLSKNSLVSESEWIEENFRGTLFGESYTLPSSTVPNISRPAAKHDASAARWTAYRLFDSGDSITCKWNIRKERQHYNSGFASCNRAGMKGHCFRQCNSFMCLCRNGVGICIWTQSGFWIL
jgi:hypothetical protein